MVYKVIQWFKNLDSIQCISLLFSLITVINSFMMIVGWDTPKEGVFAYVHLLSRLFIITVIVVICDFKELIIKFKRNNWSHTKKTIKTKVLLLLKQPLIMTSYLFTAITFILCVLNIAFQVYISPQGGKELYQTLILLFFILLLILGIISLVMKYKLIKK